MGDIRGQIYISDNLELEKFDRFLYKRKSTFHSCCSGDEILTINK